MRRYIILFVLLIFFANLNAQKYFQQRTDYKIRVRLDTAKKTLSAYEIIQYTNNSPDTLHYIYFHLWPNGYKSKHTALAKQMAGSIRNSEFYFQNKKYRGWIDSLDFKINGKKITVEYDKKNPDICKLILKEPLLPGEKITITTPFRVHIPRLTSRLGYTDRDYEITQWYPKPAVYDRYGWHAFPYLNQGEFYSEFGSYDVQITLPSNYVVAATGRMLSPTELKWQQKLELTNSRGFELDYPTGKPFKTVHFYQDSVHDFAWFASPYYYVNTDTLHLSHRIVKTKAYYFGENIQWRHAPEYVKEAVKFYSSHVGEYAYDVCTAVEGYLKAGGGMEYPTITVVSSKDIEAVIIHEVGHNWFYGMLGFNEREYPFLDEGINSYYDHRWAEETGKGENYYSEILKMFLSENLPEKIYRQWIQFLIYQLGTDFVYPQPMNLNATKYNAANYFLDIYQKTALAFRYLNHYLGEKEFDTIMHKFFEKWKFKHPYPVDIAQCFKNNASKNVNWFFDTLITSNNQIDYTIKYRNGKIILKNKNKLNVPVPIVFFKNDSIIMKKWVSTPEKIKIQAPKNFDKAIIDPFFETLEFYRYNNFVAKRLLIKKRETIRPKLEFTIGKYYQGILWITPLLYIDMLKNWKAGLWLTNMRLPNKRFTYTFMPMYDFGQKKFFGSISLKFTKNGYNGFPTQTFLLHADRYTYYDSDTSGYLPLPLRKLSFNYILTLHNKDGSEKFLKQINLGLTLISPTRLPIFSITYIMKKKSLFRPMTYRVNADFINNDYIFWTDFTYKLHYDKLSRGLKFRLFLGSNVSPTGIIYSNDYKLQYFYITPLVDPSYMYKGGFFRHQVIDEEGGLISLYPYKRYPIVFSSSIKSNIPKIPILGIFANIAYFGSLQNGRWLNIFKFQKPLWETGVMLNIIPEFFEIYLPLYTAKPIADYNNSLNKNILSHYRFVIHLNKINKILNF